MTDLNDEELTASWLKAQALVYERHQEKRSRDHESTRAANLLTEALAAELVAWDALEAHRNKIVNNHV